MGKVLIVDDVELNREILASIFEDQYEILEAADGNEACEIMDQDWYNISIIFLDLMMPKMNGLEVLAHMRLMNIIEYVPVVVITGEATEDTDMKAYEYGADDIIYKPFSSQVVLRRAKNLIEQYTSRKNMEIELSIRTEELIESHKQMEKMNEILMDALGTVVEFRNLESREHTQNVKQFTKLILQRVHSNYPEYGLNQKKIEWMSQAAALHDVGKIAIPDEILLAPRPLTASEYEKMKKHTTLGCDILKRFKVGENELFDYCYDICRWHHEKVDGKGYPDGLVGNQIPIYCQAAAIADCFDAIVSKRVYKEAVECEKAYQMIRDGECGAFSDVILHCFELAKQDMFDLVNKGKEVEDV